MNKKNMPVGVALTFATAALAATSGEWTFDTGTNTVFSNRYSSTNPGYRKAKAQLYKDGDAGYSFIIRGTGVDDCFSREVAATVERTAALTTITPTLAMRNCPKVRYVIRNDGSGGFVQLLTGKRSSEAWTTDEENSYGLNAN